MSAPLCGLTGGRTGARPTPRWAREQVAPLDLAELEHVRSGVASALGRIPLGTAASAILAELSRATREELARRRLPLPPRRAA